MADIIQIAKSQTWATVPGYLLSQGQISKKSNDNNVVTLLPPLLPTHLIIIIEQNIKIRRLVTGNKEVLAYNTYRGII